MNSKFPNNFLKIGAIFGAVFIAVVALLGLGILIGIEKESIDLVPTTFINSFQDENISFSNRILTNQYKIYEITVLFGLVVTILLCWTLYLLQKSRRNSKAIQYCKAFI